MAQRLMNIISQQHTWHLILFFKEKHYFINNYITPPISTSGKKHASPGLFVHSLISRFRGQLTRLLFNLGAIKILVTNVGPIRCIPNQRDTNPAVGDYCVTLPNQLAQLFNNQLKGLIAELTSYLEGSMFVYAYVYHILGDILNNYIAYDMLLISLISFENPSFSCCYIGGVIPCGPTSNVCWDRSKYVFWDPYHPSDAVNVIISKRLLDGDYKLY
ncbi:hypothetical protein Lal_00013339 [Lupinus albus]|nr:hypothetical protein Lal_00013339 [Lupinus albus]